MSHEITQRANGTAEMAYLGATPWHGQPVVSTVAFRADHGAPAVSLLDDVLNETMGK